MKTPEELAEEHWKYVEKILRTSNEDEETIKKIEIHYKEALKHGYKHGIQDSKESPDCQYVKILCDKHGYMALKKKDYNGKCPHCGKDVIKW